MSALLLLAATIIATGHRHEAIAEPQRSKTVVVAKAGGADAVTVAAGIALAGPNGRVRVRAGIYQESLAPSAPVELVAEGEAREVVIEGVTAPALRLTTKGVVVRGMTLRVRRGLEKAPEAGIVIDGADVALDGCVIESDAGPVVLVRGQGSRPTLSKCEIHGYLGEGLKVVGGARVTLEACVLSRNSTDGIYLDGNGTAVAAKACVLLDNLRNGIRVDHGASARFEGGRVESSGDVGVLCRGGSSTTLVGVAVVNGKSYGIIAESGASVALEGGESSGHVKSNLLIRDAGTHGTVHHALFASSAESGIYVKGTASLVLEDSELRSNGLVGIEIREGATAEIRRTKASGQLKGAGFTLHEKSRMLLDGCESFGNAGGGVYAFADADLEMRGGTIHDEPATGVFTNGDARALLTDVELRGNTSTALAVYGGAICSALRCRIHDNLDFGVYAEDKARVTLEGCDLAGNGAEAISSRKGAEVNATKSKFRDGKKNGCVFAEGGTGLLDDCDILGNALDGVLVGAPSAPTLHLCSLHKNKGVGIRVEKGGKGIFERCDLTDNGRGAWDVADAGAVDRKGNRPNK